MTDTNKMHVAFCVLGVIVGLLIGVPSAWVTHPPQGSPKTLKIQDSLNRDQLLARLGKPDKVTNPTAATNGYTIVQYESKNRGIDGKPDWGLQILIK